MGYLVLLEPCNNFSKDKILIVTEGIFVHECILSTQYIGLYLTNNYANSKCLHYTDMQRMIKSCLDGINVRIFWKSRNICYEEFSWL